MEYIGSKTGYKKVETLIDDMIADWFSTHGNCSQEVVHNITESAETKCDLFTAIVQENNGKVGCAITEYRSGKLFMSLMVCNYQTTNIVGEKVYTAGPPCTECDGKCSKRFSGLCL